MNPRNNPPDRESPADWADRLLSGVPVDRETDGEARRLQRTVELLAKARPRVGPDSGMQARIHLKLIDAWRRVGARKTDREHTWVSSLQKRRLYAAGFILLAIAALAAGWLFAPGPFVGAPAAAQKPAVAIGAGLIVAGLIAGILLWWSRHKPK